ncbi:MAG: 1,6-anhydro-N-acetylmuramyl-L-alanine amidase AmpD [Woeseiaceae bacterium]|nr:1,6-anhydro-N-acetylmuramyl-L-alanine amidase AmpD [Woeseiaceae bacterium]
MTTDDASSAAQPVFDVDAESGRLSQARFVESPNRDARPDDAEPELLIVHGISLPPGEFGGGEIEALFTNALDWDAHPYFDGIRGLEVSAHLLIRRDGEVVQFVPFTERAWHAGVSRFHGRTRCNDFSIGIELEGEDDTPYEDAQYSSLIAVIEAVKQAYPKITNRNIAGHSDVAPGRKSDPGPAFDWLRLYDALS